MDFADYPSDHPNYNIANKQVLGKFKDEMNGNSITEFIGLTPKMYAMKVEDGKEQENNKRSSNKRCQTKCGFQFV